MAVVQNRRGSWKKAVIEPAPEPEKPKMKPTASPPPRKQKEPEPKYSAELITWAAPKEVTDSACLLCGRWCERRPKQKLFFCNRVRVHKSIRHNFKVFKSKGMFAFRGPRAKADEAFKHCKGLFSEDQQLQIQSIRMTMMLGGEAGKEAFLKLMDEVEAVKFPEGFDAKKD